MRTSKESFLTLRMRVFLPPFRNSMAKQKEILKLMTNIESEEREESHCCIIKLHTVLVCFDSAVIRESS